MPKIAANITVDSNGGRNGKPVLLIEGEEFPWFVGEDLNVSLGPTQITQVHITLLADDVTFIPRER